MSERWVTESKELLKRMTMLSSKEEKDRLEAVNSILLSLNVLERSLGGWKFWVRNLSLMSHFSLKELTDIEGTLQRHVRPFIEYDIEATERWKDKFPQEPPREKPEGKGKGKSNVDTQGIYV